MTGDTRCCGCYRKTHCTSCTCVKGERQCLNCRPSMEGHCENPFNPPAAVGPSVCCSLGAPSLSNLEGALSQLTLNDEPSLPSNSHLTVSPALFLSSHLQSGGLDDLLNLVLTSPSNMGENMYSDSLPPFSPISMPNFYWNTLDGASFCTQIRVFYDEVVHWKRNLFQVPFGKAGEALVKELARLFQAYADSSSLESGALYAAMTMPPLLLQRPPGKLRTKDLSKHLERRLSLWMDGDLDSLLIEGRTIQSRIKTQKSSRSPKDMARRFTNLMFTGKVRDAIRLLSENENGAVLSLDSHVEGRLVKDILIDKHPPSKSPTPLALYSNPSPPTFHPIIFDSITSDLIRSTALRISGSSGPSGLDGSDWKRLCTSYYHSTDLCSALASLSRRICTEYVDPTGLQPLLSSRLVAIDKLPGVRPIGVGEVARCIIGKAILMLIGDDVLKATGIDQLCAGLQGGCEAAVHAVQEMFDSLDCEAIILIDASNAFNSLNRKLALLNIHKLCPSIAIILTNCYRSEIPLYIDGDIILSSEGTTQGNPLAMVMYALGVLPLIRQLNQYSISQVWYADDAAALGTIEHLRKWWDVLIGRGPQFGYHVNLAKSWIIVKQNLLDKAKSIFDDVVINITSEGHRYLGSAIGTREFISDFVQDTINDWSKQLEKLSFIACTQPHAAYSSLIHGFFNKFVFLFRTTPNYSS